MDLQRLQDTNIILDISPEFLPPIRREEGMQVRCIEVIIWIICLTRTMTMTCKRFESDMWIFEPVKLSPLASSPPEVQRTPQYRISKSHRNYAVQDLMASPRKTLVTCRTYRSPAPLPVTVPTLIQFRWLIINLNLTITSLQRRETLLS
jgi:hypothetical protein